MAPGKPQALSVVLTPSPPPVTVHIMLLEPPTQRDAVRSRVFSDVEFAFLIAYSLQHKKNVNFEGLDLMPNSVEPWLHIIIIQ